MPELPEVETFVRQLRPLIIGRKIKSFGIANSGDRLIGKQDQLLLRKYLKGDAIKAIDRHGKYLIFQLETGNRIVAHLRMTGRFVYSSEQFKNKFLRLYLEFIDGSYLNFIDIRKFATFDFQLVKEFLHFNKIKNIGPDAIDEDFNTAYFANYILHHKRPIYTTLLDQKVVAGIGNIYANEVLFKSRIHPQQPIQSLNQGQIATLIQNIKSILNHSIEFRGTTLIDNSYKDLDGNNGEFANSLLVYGKLNQSCSNCNSKILKLKISQRSIFYCPNCQKLSPSN